jgi:hypothetical protein
MTFTIWRNKRPLCKVHSLWEANCRSASQTILCALGSLKVDYCTHKSPSHCSSNIDPLSHILILHKTILMSTSSKLHFPFSNWNSACISHLFHVCCMHWRDSFLPYVLWTVHLSIILDNDQLDTQLFYFTIRLLRSSTCFAHYMLIIRRLNCIDAASGIVKS